VVHGGIDGYSRIPVFIKASTNNKSSTVLTLFLEVVTEYGLSRYVLTHPARGPGSGYMITGIAHACFVTVKERCP